MSFHKDKDWADCAVALLLALERRETMKELDMDV